MDILHYLKQQEVISVAELAKASKLIEEQEKSVEEAMIDSGVEEGVLRTAIAKYYQVPPFTLKEGFSLTEEVLSFIPEESALHYHVTPLLVEDGVLVVGVNNPDDLQVRSLKFYQLQTQSTIQNGLHV